MLLKTKFDTIQETEYGTTNANLEFGKLRYNFCSQQKIKGVKKCKIIIKWNNKKAKEKEGFGTKCFGV